MRLATRVCAVMVMLAVVLVAPADPASADGSITIYRTESGCESIRDLGLGLRPSGAGTLQVPEGDGELVAAFVEWAGYDDVTPNDIAPGGPRADSTLTINGVEVVGIQPDGDAGWAPSGLLDPWYTWYADIGPDGLGILTDSSATTLEVSGYDAPLFNNGLSLIAVYRQDSCPVPSLVEVRTGIDYYWHGLPNGEGVTDPLIYEFAPLAEDRTASFFINHAGTDSSQTECRGDAIWMLAGSGDQPATLVDISGPAGVGVNGAVEAVDDPFGSDSLPCSIEINPTPDVPYEAGHPYPGGASTAPYRVVSVDRAFEPEWTSLEIELVIPAGASWLMLQMESEKDQFGESGASLGGGPFLLAPSADTQRDLDIDVELTKGVALAVDGPFVDEVSGSIGDTVFWQLTVEAKTEAPDGSPLGPATGVTVTDVAPTGVTLLGATGDGSFDVATGIWTIGDMTPGQSATIVLESTVDAAGRHVNVADVATHVETDIDSTPGNGQNDEDDDDQASVVVDLIDVELVKLVDGEKEVQRERGDTITYTVSVSAESALDDGTPLSDVTGLAVSDVLPDNVTFVSATGDGTYDATTGEWVIGDLAAGASASIDIVATVNDDPRVEFVNRAEVIRHDQPDVDSTPGNGPQDPVEDDEDQVIVRLPSVSPTTVVNTTTTTGSGSDPTTTTSPGDIDGGEELPETGAESGWLTWLGVLVLILGVDLLIMGTSIDRLRARRNGRPA